MNGLDQRTRSDADTRAVDLASFFRGELPALLERNGRLAGRAAAVWELCPLTFEVAGEAFSLLPEAGRLRAVEGSVDAAAVAVMSRESFSDLVQEQCSTMGLVLGSMVEMTRGGLDDLIEWEPALRALLDGRPAYEPGTSSFRDRDGEPLDLKQSFRPDDDPDDMAHFLAEAGFLHLGGVFDVEEMDAISDDIDRAIPKYTPDDGRSWWAKTRSGDHRPVRLQHFQEYSEQTAALLADARFLRLGALGRSGYEPATVAGGNVVEALVKPIDVVEGISDVPWHKDCAIGRHSYRCCSLTVGVSVTGADEGSGELGVVAGSHRASLPLSGVHPRVDLPKLPLATRTGDVTVHLSCTLHMSRPPSQRERRVLYTNFGLPLREGDLDRGSDKLSAIREAAPQRMGRESTDTLGRAGSFEL